MSGNPIGATADETNGAPESASGASVCSVCGAAFECGMKAGAAECWCTRLPPVAVTPGLGCLCPRCLAARARA